MRSQTCDPLSPKPIKSFIIHPFKPCVYWAFTAFGLAVYALVVLLGGFEVGYTAVWFLFMASVQLSLLAFSRFSCQRLYGDHLRTTQNETIAYENIKAIHLITVPARFVQSGLWVCVERDTPLRYTALPAKDAEGFAYGLLERCPHATYQPKMRPMGRRGAQWYWENP